MKTKRKVRIGAVLLVVCLGAAGCEGHKHEPTELSEQMLREMTLVTPTIGGPTEEFAMAKMPADIVPTVESVLKDAGINVVRTGSTADGQWLLGQSLAGRRVLVQVLPIYPGRSTVKVTVEGADNLARDLLKRLSADIMQKTR
jgi:hypothetical protein